MLDLHLLAKLESKHISQGFNVTQHWCNIPSGDGAYILDHHVTLEALLVQFHLCYTKRINFATAVRLLHYCK